MAAIDLAVGPKGLVPPKTESSPPPEPPPPPPPPSRFPRIVLRDGAGREIDTDTSFQKAIRTAKMKLTSGGDPSSLEPWEPRLLLPHAPVPFRPDYSRVAGPARERSKIGEMTARAIADPGAISESTKKFEYRREESRAKIILNSLRDTRTLGLLGHAGAYLNQVEKECSQTTYLPFTFTTPSKNQTEQGKNRRERGEGYVFPGFCTGCQRTNALSFCYGCERDSGPHYHVDKTGRTGGGFTYIRRDRPLCQMVGKNPVNWRTMLTNIPYIYYDGMLVPSLEKYGVALHIEGLDRRLHLLTEDLAARLARLRSLGSREASQQLFLPDQLCALLSLDGDNITATPIYDEEEEEEEEDGEASFELEDSDIDSGRGGTIIDSRDGRRKSRTLRQRKIARDDDDAVCEEEPDLEEVSNDEPISEKKQLYHAPKAFQLKKREGKPTMAKSPFSANRELNIPKFRPMDVQKSEKKPTEFINIDLGDPVFKTPSPFQLKEREESPSRDNDQRRASVGGRLTALAEEEDGPDNDTDKQIQSDSQPKIMPRITEERTASPDSGVGSVKLSPSGPTRRQQRMEMSSPTRRKSFVVTENPLDDHDHHSKENEEEHVTSDNQFDGELRQRSREVIAKKERGQEPRRVRRKSTRGEEGEDDSPRDSRGSVSPDGGVVIFKEPTIPEIDHLSRLPDPLPLPKIDPPYPPKMMEFVEPVKPRRELGTTEIELPPPMVEPPRQNPPPPVVREKKKSRRTSRLVTLRRPFGAPVAVAELKDIVDPLDWLAKYCIIHPDRLPHYLRVFNKTTSDQAYRYSDVPLPDENLPDRQRNIHDSNPSTGISKLEGGASQGGQDWTRGHQGPWATPVGPLGDRAVPGGQEKLKTQKTRLTDEEKQNIRDHGVVGVCLRPEYSSIGKSEGDLAIDKINYTLDVLIDKYEDLQEKLDDYTAEKVKVLVALTRKQFPDLANPKYQQKSKRKKKKAKNEKKEEKEEDGDRLKHPSRVTGPEQEDQTNHEGLEQRSPEDPKPFGDLDIIARLEDKHLKAFSSDADLQRLNRDITRLKEKLKDVDDRIDDLEDEKKLLQLYARDEFLDSQTTNAKPEQFLRKQSPLYQKLHPTTNVEMNLSELEEALQQINGQLITQKELQYIFFILNIPGRRRIDAQLFSVIAALSEKVAQVDPFIRKLINKFDFEALNIKMDRSKELFTLLVDDDSDVPLGKIAAQMLGVELAAGGVSEEHTNYVLSKFNRDNKGVVDFLDFLTYIPLFIEVHDRILDCPLGLERSW